MLDIGLVKIWQTGKGNTLNTLRHKHYPTKHDIRPDQISTRTRYQDMTDNQISKIDQYLIKTNNPTHQLSSMYPFDLRSRENGGRKN